MSSLLGGLFALLASLFKSGSELTSKSHLNSELDEYVAAWGYRAFALPVLTVLILIVGVPDIEPMFWVALAVGTPLNVLATILYMKALKHSDISLVSPLKAMTPMALLITSPIMIGEFASPFGIAGVFFVTIGVYLLKASSASMDDVFAPFKAIGRERGAQYALGVVVIYSITANIDKVGVEASSPIFWTFAVHLVLAVILLIIVQFKSEDNVGQAFGEWKALLPMGTLSGLGVAAQMFALTYTLVVYVIAIKRTALLWNILGGALFFGEEGLQERIVGGVFIVIGVVIISISL